MRLTALLFVLCAASLSACETMSPSECKVANWDMVGYQDGAEGKRLRELADYVKDCAKAGVMPDRLAYESGWERGIQTYCTPVNGWRVGIDGHDDGADACRGQPGYEGFARYYDAGMRLHETTQRLKSREREQQNLQKKLEEAKTDEEKKNLRSELSRLDRELAGLRERIAIEQLAAPAM